MKKQEHVAKSIGVRTGPRAATAASHSPAGTFARSSSSRRAFTFLLASSLAVVFIGLIAAGASAVELRSFSSSFGAPGTGNGQLELRTHSSVAINQSTGNVYVSDTGNGRVAEFKADGTFIRNFGSFTTPTFIAVDGSAGGEGNVYVADSGTNTVSKFNGEGTPITTWAGSGQLSGLGALAGIAVSPTGDFFVLEENSTNRKYSPAGVELSSFGSPRGTSPFGLAIDTEGNLYQADGSPEITKYTQTGENLGEPDTRGDAVALATDSNNGDLYVVQGNNSGFVNRYAMNCGQACTPIEGFGEGELSDPQGIALNATTHDVYVANAGSSTIGIAKIEDVEPAEATLGPASEVEYITATVSGEVNPKGHTTSCRFEYVTDEQFSGTDERQSLRVSASAGTYTLEFLGDVTAPLPFDATAPEIETALNSLNSIGGAGGSVHVTAKPQQSFSRFYDIVFGGTLGKHDVEELAAHGDGLIGREESASPSTFDQGHAPAGFSEPSAVACATNPGSGSGFTPVSVKLVSLRANTSYHYRLSARLTTTADPGGTFQTKVVTPPVVSIDSVTDITSSTARVVGHITPGGTAAAFDTIWYVECHGCNGGQNNPVIPGDVASHEVSTEVKGLKPGGEATVEIFAENRGGLTKSGSLHFKALGVSPTVSATYVSAVGNDSATLNALVNPGGSLTTFHFEYVTKAEYEASGFIGATTAPVPDQALPGVNERQRIEVGFQSVPFLSVALGQQSSVTFPATAGAAEVQGALEGIPAIGTGGVEVTDVRAGVWDVEFTGALAETNVEQLEVFPQGQSEVLRKGGPPTSFADHPTATELQGLQSGVEYVYRVVASNEHSSGVAGSPAYLFTVPKTSADEGCLNSQLRTENNSTLLPECRAFEAVSGPRDGEVYPPFVPDRTAGQSAGEVGTTRPMQTTPTGGSVTYAGVPPRHATGEGTGGPGIQNSGDQYLANRTATGWVAEDIMPRGRGIDPEVGGYYGFNEGLTKGVLMLRHGLPEVPLSPEVTANCTVLYSRSFPTRNVEPFFLTSPCGEPIYVGSSADGSAQVFESSAVKTPGTSEAAGGGHENLYYKTPASLFAINILPNGSSVPDATVGALAPEREVISEPLIPAISASHAISADGSSVVWTDLSSGMIYVRQNPAAATECTAPGEISKACTVQVSSGSATYQDATPDGRYIYYTEADELWRFDSQSRTRQPLAGSGADVLGVVGVNTTGEDGSYLYFVAEGALSAGSETRTCKRAMETSEDPQLKKEAREEAEGKSPPGRGCNLYLIHNGQITLVTVLAPADNQFAESFGNPGEFSGVGDWTPVLGLRTAQLTPDGHSLVFMSVRRFGDYANQKPVGACSAITSHPREEGQGSLPCTEIYIFDTDAGAGEEISCVSCNPTGEPGTEGEGSNIPGSETFLPLAIRSLTHVQRAISTDGSRVFFQTAQALVSGDSNHTEDVYEWVRQGSPSCANDYALNSGCLYILSGGQGENHASLLESDPSGSNVFFTTRATLSPVDQDFKVDLYDARVGGGFPVPAAAVACEAEACKGPVSPPPPEPAAPTSGFRSDEPTPPCPKGTRKVHGRCVKKAKHHHHHRKHKHRHGGRGK